MRNPIPTTHRRRLVRSACVLAGLALAFARDPAPLPRTHAQTTLPLIGQLGGPVQAVAVAGSVTYAGVGPRVVALIGCDPAFPEEVARTEPLPGIVQDIQLRDGTAFVAAGVGGMVVLDVRDPRRPAVIGRLQLPGVTARVVLQGPLAYVSAGARGVYVVDIASPAAPRVLGHYQAITSDLAVHADYAYVVTRNLEQVYVGEPAGPRLQRKIEDWADAIDMAGPILYVATSESRPSAQRFGSLRIYDVSYTRDPARLVSSLPIGDQAREILVAGGRVYYQGLHRLTVIDVADIRAPRVLGAVATADSVRTLFAAGRRLYQAAGQAGLRALEVADPAAMREARVMDTLGSAESVVVWNGYAFVEDEGSGNRLLVVDVRDPANPVARGVIQIGADHGSIAAAAGYLYVGAPDRTVRVFDVRRPEQARQVASLAMPRDPVSGREMAVWRLAVEADRYLYVANDEWLRVYDVADPAAPREVSRRRSSGGATDIAVHDRRAYLLGPATGTQTGRPSLQIVDVFDFNDPVQFGVIDATGSQGGVQTDGQFVYVEGVQVVDVRNPERPAEVARLSLPGRNRDSMIFGDRLYLARSNNEGGGSLRVIDISVRAGPREVAAVELVEPARDVFRSGDVFVAAQGLGLVILRDGWGWPTPQPTATVTPGPPPTVTPGGPELPERAFLPVLGRGGIGECR